MKIRSTALFVALLVALLCLTPTAVLAQSASDAKQVVVVPSRPPAVRFVPPRPGGRRVIIVTSLPGAPAPAAVSPVPAAVLPAARPDLVFLEARLLDLTRRLDAALARPSGQNNAELNALRQQQSELMRALDSLRRAMDNRALDNRALDNLNAGAPGFRERVRIDTVRFRDNSVPTVEVVERSLLDTGLFTAVQVVFEFDSHTLLPAAYPTLNTLAEVLRRNPEVSLDIVGHTDSVGSADYNLALSQRRAASVATYIRTLGIRTERLQAKGRGESYPVAENNSPTGRTLNRRVEFVVQ